MTSYIYSHSYFQTKNIGKNKNKKEVFCFVLELWEKFSIIYKCIQLKTKIATKTKVPACQNYDGEVLDFNFLVYANKVFLCCIDWSD